MSLVEVHSGAISAKLPEKEAPTAKAAWADSIHLPGKLSAGMGEMISGKAIGPEMKYDEVLLVLEGEADIKERKTGETYTIKKEDLVILKRGAKVTITTKAPLRYLYVTVPPHSEQTRVYYLEKED